MHCFLKIANSGVLVSNYFVIVNVYDVDNDTVCDSRIRDALIEAM